MIYTNMKLRFNTIFILLFFLVAICYGRIFISRGNRINQAGGLDEWQNTIKAHEIAYNASGKSGTISTYFTRLPLQEFINSFVNSVPGARLVFKDKENALLRKIGNPAFSWLCLSNYTKNETIIFQITKTDSTQKPAQDIIPPYPSATEIFRGALTDGAMLVIADSDDAASTLDAFYATAFLEKGMPLMFSSSPGTSNLKIFANARSICITTTSTNKKNAKTRIAILHKSQINN